MNSTFTELKIRAHLDRVLDTPAFSNSSILTNFLTFIVNETLAGRSHEIKEYTIGTNALKRDVDFNPQIDSIVRIHAGRLRRSLKEYYYETGRHDEIEIVVPKGGYVPLFKENTLLKENTPHDPTVELGTKGQLTPPKITQTRNKASLAIFPFDDISETDVHRPFVKGLEVYLSARLTNEPNLTVVSYYTSNHLPEHLTDIREAGNILNALFILTGCVQADKHLRVHVFLNECETGEQRWGMTFERKDLEKLDLFMIQEEIVNTVIGSITGPGGIISIHNLAGESPPQNQDIIRLSQQAESEKILWKTS